MLVKLRYMTLSAFLGTAYINMNRTEWCQKPNFQSPHECEVPCPLTPTGMEGQGPVISLTQVREGIAYYPLRGALLRAPAKARSAQRPNQSISLDRDAESIRALWSLRWEDLRAQGHGDVPPWAETVIQRCGRKRTLCQRTLRQSRQSHGDVAGWVSGPRQSQREELREGRGEGCRVRGSGPCWVVSLNPWAGS